MFINQRVQLKSNIMFLNQRIQLKSINLLIFPVVDELDHEHVESQSLCLRHVLGRDLLAVGFCVVLDVLVRAIQHVKRFHNVGLFWEILVKLQSHFKSHAAPKGIASQSEWAAGLHHLLDLLQTKPVHKYTSLG